MAQWRCALVYPAYRQERSKVNIFFSRWGGVACTELVSMQFGQVPKQSLHHQSTANGCCQMQNIISIYIYIYIYIYIFIHATPPPPKGLPFCRSQWYFRCFMPSFALGKAATKRTLLKSIRFQLETGSNILKRSPL